jgi:arsenate reductase
MHAPTLYGIRNCDTVKKARDWFSQAGLEHRFHDFRAAGLPEATLARWLADAGWEALLNRKGTTWRQLDETARAGAVDAASVAALLRASPALIKRPVVEWPDGRVTVGFDAAVFARRAVAIRQMPCLGAPCTDQ